MDDKKRLKLAFQFTPGGFFLEFEPRHSSFDQFLYGAGHDRSASNLGGPIRIEGIAFPRLSPAQPRSHGLGDRENLKQGVERIIDIEAHFHLKTPLALASVS